VSFPFRRRKEGQGRVSGQERGTEGGDGKRGTRATVTLVKVCCDPGDRRETGLDRVHGRVGKGRGKRSQFATIWVREEDSFPGV